MSALVRGAIQATYGHVSAQERVEAALDATFGVVTKDADGGDLVDSLRSGGRLG